MRRAAAVFGVLSLLAVGALLLVGAGRKTNLAFTLGVTPGAVVATLGPGETVCQDPIDVPHGGSFDNVSVPLGTFGKPGSSVEVIVRGVPSDAVLSRGTLPGGYPDVADRAVERIGVAPAVHEGNRIKVCLRNAGTGRVALYGNNDLALSSSTLVKDGHPLMMDADLSFSRGSRSVLSLFGVSADHAALFKAGWVGPWTFWLLAALVALGVPALLAFALLRAGRDDDDAV